MLKDYGVFLSAGDPVTKGLVYSTTRQFVVHVTCTDVNGGATTKDFTVSLLEDKPPTLNNLPGNIDSLLTTKDFTVSLLEDKPPTLNNLPGNIDLFMTT